MKISSSKATNKAAQFAKIPNKAIHKVSFRLCRWIPNKLTTPKIRLNHAALSKEDILELSAISFLSSVL
jgi:hypothetical protein